MPEDAIFGNLQTYASLCICFVGDFYVPTFDLKLQELNLIRCEMVPLPATSRKETRLVGIFTITANAACDQSSFQAVPHLQQGKRKIRQTSKMSQHRLDTSHIEIK